MIASAAFYALAFALTVAGTMAACELYSRRAWTVARKVARQDVALVLETWKGKAELAEAELRDLRNTTEIESLQGLVSLLEKRVKESERLQRAAEESEAELLCAAQVTTCRRCGRVETGCKSPGVLVTAGGEVRPTSCGVCDWCVGD